MMIQIEKKNLFAVYGLYKNITITYFDTNVAVY